MTALRSPTVLVAVLAALLTTSRPSPQGASPSAGETAPDFSCTDWKGEPLSWSSFANQAVLVFFHAPRMPYSSRAFSELLTLLKANPRARERTAVLLVLNDAGGVEEIADRLTDCELRWRIAVDPDRASFASFHVVAFPTAFCVAPDREIISVVKGFGPLTAYRMVLGSRLAAGLIDRAAYEQSMAGGAPAPVDPNDRLRVRYMNLARKLLIGGRVDDALAPLQQAEIAAPSDPVVLAVLARALLYTGRDESARTRIERLAEVQPQGVDLLLLRARLAIRDGELDRAREELKQVDVRLPEASLLRGILLATEGRFKEASEYHRRTVERLLWREVLPEPAQVDAAAPPGAKEPAGAEGK